MTFKIDETYLTKLTQDLVQIDSTNPSLSPDGKGEAELGNYVAEKLKELGLEVTVSEIAPGRVNTVGVLKGTGGGKSLLLNAHMDTVGVEGMTIDPFGGELKDGRVYGRGAQDMKGSLAAMIATAKAIVDAGIRLRGDLLITGVADGVAACGEEGVEEGFACFTFGVLVIEIVGHGRFPSPASIRALTRSNESLTYSASDLPKSW